MWFSKQTKPTADTVMRNVVLLSDGQLIEIYHRIRAVISNRSGDREDELLKLTEQHEGGAASLRSAIAALHDAIGFKPGPDVSTRKGM